MSLVNGKNVVIVIFAPAYTRLHKELTAQGGHNRKNVTRTTDYVVSNGKACKELSRAHALGTRIITQAQFEGLLAGEPLPELEVSTPDVGVNDAFGQARSVFQDPTMHTRQRWGRVVELLDACEPDALEALTHYVDTFIARGERDAHFDGLFPYDYNDEDCFRFFGRAPTHWYAGLADGERSPKYRLVRELDLLTGGLTGNMVARMIDHPDLSGLQRLCLSSERLPTSGLIKRLCQSDSLDDLRCLGLPMLGEKAVGYFEAHGQESRTLEMLDLTALDALSKERKDLPALLDRLCRVPFFSTIKMLCLPMMYYYQDLTVSLDALLRDELLPELEHLHVGGSMYSSWSLQKKVLIHPKVQERVRRLSCGIALNPDYMNQVHAFRECWQVDYSGHLELLDLSGIVPGKLHEGAKRRSPETVDAVRACIAEHLPGSKLLESVDALHLGFWLTSDLQDALTDAHPNLHVS